MRRLIEFLSMISVIGLIAFFLWMRHNAVVTSTAALPSPKMQDATPGAAQNVHTQDDQPDYPEREQARDMVTIVSPLGDYMSRPHRDRDGEGASHDTDDPSTQPSDASGHVTGSRVGTGNPILHKTFLLAKAANLPFEISPHTAIPKLHGTYHSFLQHAGPGDGDGANIDFLVLNQQQYSDLIHQRPSDALFSADGAHDQEVNVTLPPTLNHPANYYLVFRNGSNAGKIGVEADFRVDF